VDRLARLVRQHAHTARLMGVDFVPAYRSASAPARDLAEHLAPSAPESTGASRVEPKPRPLLPADGARTRESVQAALDDLRERYIADAPHRAFPNHGSNIVFGEGDPLARLMFVGEAPGEEEDRTGRPFVGRAGQLLDKMIQAMGLARADVYICNVLKTRPPNNATPTLEEAQACEPYLFEQIALIAPGAIVTLGKSASQCLLKLSDSMSSMRGRWHQLRLPAGPAVPVMPTFHPAYLLRAYTPENRQKVWSDLRLVMDKLGMAAPAKPPA
jgi:DNA polymerase